MLYRGGFGVGGEIGHIRMVEGGRPCGCGQRGCWEQYASGSALVREARERAAELGPTPRCCSASATAPRRASPASTSPQAAREGDPFAKAAFDTLGHWLGQGLADLAAVLDPECFVLGGGVSEAGDLRARPDRAAFEHLLTGRGTTAHGDRRAG